MGRNSKGETGQFPAGFVQLTDATDTHDSQVSAFDEIVSTCAAFEPDQIKRPPN